MSPPQKEGSYRSPGSPSPLGIWLNTSPVTLQKFNGRALSSQGKVSPSSQAWLHLPQDGQRVLWEALMRPET